jgi:hypothetical protein
MNDHPGTLAVAEIAALCWKLCSSLERELEFIPAERMQSVEAGLRFARRKLAALLASQEMHLETYEGSAWSPQIPATALNSAEVEGAHTLVESTVEPTIMGDKGIILSGKVILREI